MRVSLIIVTAKEVCMKKIIIISVCALLFYNLFLPYAAMPWELPLLTDKQGTFEFFSRTDYADGKCGFTRVEMEANLKEIVNLVGAMRKSPVLADLKGYDSHVRIANIPCGGAGAYGIPSVVSFGFCSWFMRKDGIPARNTIEPPDWEIIVNRQQPSAWPRFDGGDDWFMVPVNKKTLQPGIDLYDNATYVLYDPDRPAYWLPVTVREAVDGLIAYWQAQPDKFSADFMLKMIKEGYAAFPEAERDKLAHYGGDQAEQRNVLGVTTDPGGSLIMRATPEYWDKKLPRSAIQFLYFSVPNPDYSRKLMEEALKGNSTSYHLYRFEASLDINTVRLLVPLIRK